MNWYGVDARIDEEVEKAMNKSLRFNNLMDRASAVRKVESLESYNHALESRLERILELVRTQANDEGLWFDAKTAPEGYLQVALRQLHAVTEGKTAMDVMKEAMMKEAMDMTEYQMTAWNETHMNAYKRLAERVRVQMSWTHDKAMLWMMTPNPMLGGVAPDVMIAKGRAHRLEKFIDGATTFTVSEVG